MSALGTSSAETTVLQPDAALDEIPVQPDGEHPLALRW